MYVIINIEIIYVSVLRIIIAVVLGGNKYTRKGYATKQEGSLPFWRRLYINGVFLSQTFLRQRISFRFLSPSGNFAVDTV